MRESWGKSLLVYASVRFASLVHAVDEQPSQVMNRMDDTALSFPIYKQSNYYSVHILMFGSTPRVKMLKVRATTA